MFFPPLFWLVYTSTLLSVLLFERLMNVVLLLFSRGFSGSKKISAKQVVVGNVSVVSSLFTNMLLLAFRFWVILLSWWLLFFTMFVVLSIVYVTYEEDPYIWIAFMRFYNANVGPWISYVILVPLYITNLFLKSVIPLYNAFVWFFRVLLIEGVFPMLLDRVGVVLQLAQAFLDLMQSITQAIIDYLNTFDCAGTACLVPGHNVLNIISPMGNVRQMVALSVQIARHFCSLAAVPLDLLTYPFMDMNLAAALHHFVNAGAQLFVGIPFATSVRCSIASDPTNTFRVMMCTPDLTPFFTYVAAGVSSLGLLLDNILNIALVILEQAVLGTAPSCDMLSYGLVSDLMSSEVLFAARTGQTTVVGLTAWNYAVTDGIQIVYKGQNDQATKLGTWPYAVDTSFGVAAVSYAKVNNVDVSVVSDGSTVNSLQTTAMLGCNCTDAADAQSQLSITCAIAPMDSWVDYYRSDYLLHVDFPNTQITQGLMCSMIDVHVKSVRWSFYRYSSADIKFGSDTVSMPTVDCINAGTCRQVDATVWVVPRCGGDTGSAHEICLPTSSDCFPYCMGTRVSGSSNNNILLGSALQWKRGRTLLDIDCNVYASTPASTTASSAVANNIGFQQTSVVQKSASVLGATVPTSLYSSHPVSSSSSPECYPTANVISSVPSTSYNPSVYNTYATQQPFVLSGDVVFTPKDIGGGFFAVKIDRLVGDQQNSFSMEVLNQDFPAEAPLNVPADEYSFVNQVRFL